MAKLRNVEINNKKIKLNGILAAPINEVESGVVFLHGGGTASSKRYEEIQKDFVTFGIASLALDFRGCGDSGGEFADGSLDNRVKDAFAGLEYFTTEIGIAAKDMYLWGSSMGAHVACRALSNVEPKGIILQSAAAYGKKAEKLPLGKEFSEEIGVKNSYVNSPAYVELRKFTGKILVMYGTKDTVIPKDVRQEYRNITREKGGTYFEFAGGEHAMLSPKTEEERMVFEMMKEVGRGFVLG